MKMNKNLKDYLIRTRAIMVHIFVCYFISKNINVQNGRIEIWILLEL